VKGSSGGPWRAGRGTRERGEKRGGVKIFSNSRRAELKLLLKGLGMGKSGVCNIEDAEILERKSVLLSETFAGFRDDGV